MPRKYEFAPNGMVMKVTKVGKQELYTEATSVDIKTMNTSEQIAFASAIKDREAQRKGKRKK